VLVTYFMFLVHLQSKFSDILIIKRMNYLYIKQ